MHDATETLAPEHHAVTTATPHAAPKWAAVVADRLIPLPRQRLKGRDILAQAGRPDAILLRDYNQPGDVVIHPDETVDLAECNVFRLVDACDAPHPGLPREAAKLAFIMDDAWEVTIQPVQTLQSLRGLFGLPDDAQIFRDYESPNDQEVEPGTKVQFADGPVFIARIEGLTVKVNRQPVHFKKRRETGLQIKQTAIDQKVAIELGFVLHRKQPDGEYGPAIRDDEAVILKECDEFRCVAPYDNS